MAGVVVRRIGKTVEIRHPDVPLFDSARGQQVLTDQARAFFELALQELAGHISDAAPVGVSGNLAQSFAGDLGSTGGTEITGSTLEELEGRVFSSLPYAVVMNEGRTPGARMPPPDALVPWVRRVLNVGGSDDEVRAVAFAVARSIGRKGITARKFVEKGVDRALPRVQGIFALFGEAIANGLVQNDSGAGA